MATNKHATIRYQALDKCFRNPGRKYYIDDLIEACNIAIYDYTGIDLGVKRRQIFDDIKFMESPQGWNIPLDHNRDGHKVYYRYEDMTFSINNQPLNENEETQLKETLLTLSRFKGMPQFEWMDEILARLDSGLGLTEPNAKIIKFDQNNYLKGLEFISPIYNSILYKKTICIIYKSFRIEGQQRIELHPYFLKQYNNRWYIFGKSNESGYLINLALDRIVSIEDSKIKYLPNETVDFEEYFEDIVGVTLYEEKSIEKIVIQIKNVLWPYIQTKPIHWSQKFIQTNESFTTISLDLIPNYELESILFSYGEGLEVVSPEHFRDKMKNRSKEIFSNYKKNADQLHSL